MTGDTSTDPGDNPAGIGASVWRRLLDEIEAEAPPPLEVAERLADARSLSVADAQAAVYDAVDAGVLVDEGDGFGAIRMKEAEEADSDDETPTPDDPEPGVQDGENGSSEGITTRDGEFGSWTEADFTDLEPETWAPALLDVDAWMLRKEGKAPWAPWVDPDAPVECQKGHPDRDDEPETSAECGHSARFKWGSEGSGEYVHADSGTALDWREKHPQASSDLVFIQQEADPFAFVDGDDVRDPETGEVHPEFLRILDALGVSYADVSTSGSGVHVMYRAELPEGLRESRFTVDDEAFGANDEGDLPTVEIYDGKHVCVATGDHVAGTGLQVREWDDDGLESILDEYEELPEENPSDAFDDFDADDYEPQATDSTETTDDIRDVFAAIDRLDARRVADRTIVSEWVDPPNVENRAFIPTWAPAGYEGTANFANQQIWKDSGDRGGYGGPVVMAAIDARLVKDKDCPRAVKGETWFEALDHLRDRGFSIPVLERGGSSEDYDDDPRTVEATVDPRRAWDAAGRVTPDDLNDTAGLVTQGSDSFACPCCGEAVDVVRAVAVEEGLIETCDAGLDDAYPRAYEIAREEYEAPLPRYLTTGDAVAEFDAVLSLISEVTFWHFDVDELRSEVTQEDDEVGGDAVRALNPAWRESESEASVLVFPSGTIWDADTERTLDALRFIALDAGIIDDPSDSLEGGRFTTAYRLARRHYGAPLPRWEPAEDGAREVTPMLPPSGEIVDDPESIAVSRDQLDEARDQVEALIEEVGQDAGTPSVVRALPATGKTTGTIKTAAERPTSYLAPRKELQQQALDKAEKWGISARVLPVFSDKTVDPDALDGAVAHVRAHGKDRLRDRWAILTMAVDDPDELFVDEDEDDDTVDLDRATCETADGEHGKAWALAVHVARRLGYTPQEIHQKSRGLFGAPIPCSCHDHDDEESRGCSYSDAWDEVSNPDAPADLLVGSYVHAHVESVRTEYTRSEGGEVRRNPRTVVLDEFPGEAFSREFGEEATDFATWLACALREDIDDHRDLLTADLGDDPWVTAWLNGAAAEQFDSVENAVECFNARADALEAVEAARDILDEVDGSLLEDLGVEESLEELAEESLDANLNELVDELGAGADVAPDRPGSGIAQWVEDAVVDPLLRTADTANAPIPVDDLPDIGGELFALVERAVKATVDGEEGAEGLARAASSALTGGPDGCRDLAVWADDGYAHPDAHHLLQATITPGASPDSTTVATDSWAFDPDATDGTRVDAVSTAERATTVLDRNDHGAILHTPPARHSAGEDDAPLVGLDATARAPLWSVALGEEAHVTDIHDTEAERAEFLESALGLRVIQASTRPRPYEGSPGGKDLDGDVALLEALTEEFEGVHAPRERGGEPIPVGKPAAITTKSVREVLENDDRLDDIVSVWENYGNVTGANDLGGHRLAAILGSQHFGDDAVERFCALAGVEVDTSRTGGRGGDLDYGADLANEYLGHMREDQTMQAILRFTRGDSGATVVARTSALRDDLPVVGDGQVVETWSETATKVARAWRALGTEFTRADVEDAVDVSPRQVRRVLAELVDAGYLRRASSGPGTATVYEPGEQPGAGEVKLDSVEPGGEPEEGGTSASIEYYTWNVRVFARESRITPAGKPAPTRKRGAPPAPTAVDGGEPPG